MHLVKMTPYKSAITTTGDINEVFKLSPRQPVFTSRSEWYATLSPSYNPAVWDNTGPCHPNAFSFMDEHDYYKLNKADLLIPMRSRPIWNPEASNTFVVTNDSSSGIYGDQSYIDQIEQGIANKLYYDPSILWNSKVLSGLNHVPEFLKGRQVFWGFQCVTTASNILESEVYSVSPGFSGTFLDPSPGYTQPLNELLGTRPGGYASGGDFGAIMRSPWSDQTRRNKLWLGIAAYVNEKHQNKRYSLVELMSQVELLIGNFVEKVLTLIKEFDYHKNGTALDVYARPIAEMAKAYGVS